MRSVENEEVTSFYYIDSSYLPSFPNRCVPLYNKQPSKPKNGLIVRLKDSSAKWKVTLENRSNELVYSVATNGLFPSSTFRIKRTKVPLLLETIG